jgi:rhodanese-related sulfurtransferase
VTFRATGNVGRVDIPEVDVAELAARRAEGAVLIDVRESHELVAASLSGVHHIPLGDVVERSDEIDATGTVYVICARGARSAKAVQHYRSLGIDAVNVAGGMLAWIDAGLPIEQAGNEAEGA